jgi:multidrug efflux system membrane fusion protein
MATGLVMYMATGIASKTPIQVADDETRVELPAVRVLASRSQTFDSSVSVYGRTAPVRTSTLSAETSGRVTRIVADRGEAVGLDELILELDVRGRQERVTTARALVRQRELEHQAQVRLSRDSYVSEATLAGAVANLEAARGELRQAELDLQYRQLRAPYSGVVQDRMVEVGDFVSIGDPLVTFVDRSSLIVVGTIAEREIVGMVVGAAGSARLATGQVVSGRVRYIAPVADPDTRTFRVELEIPNDGDLRGGVTTEMTLAGSTRAAHRIAPSLLTLNDSGQLGVKIVEDGDTVRFVNITILGSDDQGTWIGGLADQADIITFGQGWVRDGDMVRVSYDEDRAAADTARSD